jgi:hypothetical protein
MHTDAMTMNATTKFTTESSENISLQRPKRTNPAATHPTQIQTIAVAPVEVRPARCDSTKGACDMTVVTGLIESGASVGVAGISSGQMTSAISESWLDRREDILTATVRNKSVSAASWSASDGVRF